MFSRDSGTGLRVNLLDVRVRQEITESKQQQKSLRHHNLNSHFLRMQRPIINRNSKADHFYMRKYMYLNRRKSNVLPLRSTYATKRRRVKKHLLV